MTRVRSSEEDSFTSWVVCACVEDDDRMLRGVAQVLHEPREVQALLLRVPVAVLVQPRESGIPDQEFILSEMNGEQCCGSGSTYGSAGIRFKFRIQREPVQVPDPPGSSLCSGSGSSFESAWIRFKFRIRIISPNSLSVLATVKNYFDKEN